MVRVVERIGARGRGRERAGMRMRDHSQDSQRGAETGAGRAQMEGSRPERDALTGKRRFPREAEPFRIHENTEHKGTRRERTGAGIKYQAGEERRSHSYGN
jgi:hypothetical protein